MIHSFSASYAGHVFDDNLGFAGTAANDRWYSNDQLAQVFDWSVDIAQHLDRLAMRPSGNDYRASPRRSGEISWRGAGQPGSGYGNAPGSFQGPTHQIRRPGHALVL